MKEFLFIISTKAGSRSHKLHEQIQREMQLQKISFLIRETKHKNHAQELARDFSCQKEDSGVVIVCGGDGTLNEAANALAGTKTAMGVLPTGTANDFSKTLYKDREIEGILKNFHKGFFSPIDLIETKLSDHKSRYCLNVLSFGFDTIILKEAYKLLEEHPKLKAKAYYAAILKSILKINSYPYEIYSYFNEKIFHRNSEYILGAICNGSFYGNGFNPNPKGRLNDGTAFLVLLENISKYKIPRLILKYKKGSHLQSKDILTQLTQKGMITSPENILCNIDGEIFNTRKIEWSVEKNALNFFHLENHHLN